MGFSIVQFTDTPYYWQLSPIRKGLGMLANLLVGFLGDIKDFFSSFFISQKQTFQVENQPLSQVALASEVNLKKIEGEICVAESEVS